MTDTIAIITWGAHPEQLLMAYHAATARLGKVHTPECIVWSLDYQAVSHALEKADYQRLRQIMRGAHAWADQAGVTYLLYYPSEFYYWHHALDIGQFDRMQLVDIVTAVKRVLRDYLKLAPRSKIGIIGSNIDAEVGLVAPIHTVEHFWNTDRSRETASCDYLYTVAQHGSAFTVTHAIRHPEQADPQAMSHWCKSEIESFTQDAKTQAIVLSDFEVERWYTNQSLAAQYLDFLDMGNVSPETQALSQFQPLNLPGLVRTHCSVPIVSAGLALVRHAVELCSMARVPDD